MNLYPYRYVKDLEVITIVSALCIIKHELECFKRRTKHGLECFKPSYEFIGEVILKIYVV